MHVLRFCLPHLIESRVVGTHAPADEKQGRLDNVQYAHLALTLPVAISQTKSQCVPYDTDAHFSSDYHCIVNDPRGVLCQESKWKLQKLKSARIRFACATQLRASIAARSARQWKRRRTSIVHADTLAARAKLRNRNWFGNQVMNHAIRVPKPIRT